MESRAVETLVRRFRSRSVPTRGVWHPSGIELNRLCPVCDGTRARTVWREGLHRYVACSNCSAVFSDVDAATYEAGQHNVWHDDELSSDTVAFYGRARLRAHTDFLRRYPPRGAGRLLDVGCGLGYFLERAAHAGWDVHGCEPSAAWADRAAAKVGAERVYRGPPRADMFAGRRFDLVTAWDVLEHVFDPIPFLRTLALLLADDGRLFIRTPNIAWVRPTYAVRRRLGERVELGALNHVVYFGARTLRRALARARLVPVAWPALPPPQVGFANRDPSQAGRLTAVVRARNAYAQAAGLLAAATGGRLVVGPDLDVLSVRVSP